MTIKQDNEGIKHDDPPSTSTNDDPSATPISNTLPTSTTSDSDSSLAPINLANPRQTLDASTNPSIQLTAPTPTDDLLPISTTTATTTDQMIVSNNPSICPDGYILSPSGDCRIVINNPSSGITSTKNSSSTTPIPKLKLDNQSSTKLETNKTQSSISNITLSILSNTSQPYCNPVNTSCPLPD